MTDTEVCICPHCIHTTVYLPQRPNQRCTKCYGLLTFEAFRNRMVEVCRLERTYNIEDPRKETP